MRLQEGCYLADKGKNLQKIIGIQKMQPSVLPERGGERAKDKLLSYSTKASVARFSGLPTTGLQEKGIRNGWRKEPPKTK